MVERFFPMKASSGGGGNLRRENLTLLTGPISSYRSSNAFSLTFNFSFSVSLSLIHCCLYYRGKTSLLFQFALNVANASESNRVVFICHRKRIESNPPFLSQGIDPSSDVFDRIQMKYVDDDEGIRKYFAAFHLHLDFPAAVVIDDFGDYFTQLNSKGTLMNSRARDMAMVRTLALCHNAIVDANKKAACELVLTETNPGDSLRSLFIYKRWITTIFTIKGHGDGSFLLRSNGSSEKIAKYSITLQYLILEEEF